jgi:hypothetical protein
MSDFLISVLLGLRQRFVHEAQDAKAVAEA